jgi:hypothetical protein
MKHTELPTREAAFWHEVAENVHDRGQRLGQAVSNAGMADMPEGTEASLIDPFHRDSRVGVFMARLRQQWLDQ